LEPLSHGWPPGLGLAASPRACGERRELAPIEPEGYGYIHTNIVVVWIERMMSSRLVVRQLQEQCAALHCQYTHHSLSLLQLS
jgi:hypothetical protein